LGRENFMLNEKSNQVRIVVFARQNFSIGRNSKLNISLPLKPPIVGPFSARLEDFLTDHNFVLTREEYGY
jgi:hypothetical protein